MLARGLITLHTLPLLGRKSSSVKSRVSITSKLIESKRLQVLYFGHLRKTGGVMDIQRKMSTLSLPKGSSLYSALSFWAVPHSPLPYPGKRFTKDSGSTRRQEKARRVVHAG